MVPGTLAAYYFDGTGGFVLARHVPYVLDPRTPLLQTIEIRRPIPKASHLKLAAIHDPDVVAAWPEDEIERSHWQDGRWPEVVRRVLDFQTNYSTNATSKMQKYNDLLLQAGRSVVDSQPEDPLRLVPPYWAVGGVSDPWWTLSLQAIEVALEEYAGGLLPILTLRADQEVAELANLVDQLPDACDDVFCWVSNWDEAEATSDDVAGWLEAIEAAQARGIAVRNLYGGYLSVLLTGRGLAGVNHGVGYSESRDSRRLSATGSPPARYYLPALREFFTVPNAQPVIDHLPEEWACGCPVCQEVSGAGGRPEVGRLNVEGLKRHFLLARHEEFARIDASLDSELSALEEVGEWVVEHERPFLPAEHGERLVRWATAVRPD